MATRIKGPIDNRTDDQSGRDDARKPVLKAKPREGAVDYDRRFRETMAKYPKVIARLAK